MVLDAIIVFEMFAVCFGFDGHICPVVDGETQYWDEDILWKVIYMPYVMKWMEPEVTDQWLTGRCVEGVQGAFGQVQMTLIIGGSPLIDKFGYSVLTHEIRHAMNSCADWEDHE